MYPMTSTERIFFRLEREGFPIDVVGIALLAPATIPLPFAQVRHRILSIIGTAPYLTRRVAPAPLGIGEDRWIDIDGIDPDSHLRQVTCPAPGDERALLDLVLELTAQPLDRSRPLWEVWYVDGMSEGRSALVLRGHHALTDGLGFMRLYQAVFDDSPDLPTALPTDLHIDRETDRDVAPAGEADPTGAPMPTTSAEASVETLRRAAAEIPERIVINTRTGARIVRTVAAGSPRVAGKLAQGAVRRLTGAARERTTDGVLPQLPGLPRFVPSWTSHPPVTRFNNHVSDPAKSMAVLSLPLAQVQAARAAHPGSTVHEVILALVTGGLRRYLEPLGELPDEPLVTTCPVSVRAKSGQGTKDAKDAKDTGNAFTAVWVELPVHLDDPVARLAAVHAGSSRAKGHLGGSRASWDLLSDVGDMLLPGMVSAAMGFAGSRVFQVFPPTLNLSVSTMRGSSGPLYFGGRKVEHLYARTIICPPVHLFVHAITYDGKIEMGVLSVRQLLPDPDVLAAGIEAELAELLARSAAVQSPPGEVTDPARPGGARRSGRPRPRAAARSRSDRPSGTAEE